MIRIKEWCGWPSMVKTQTIWIGLIRKNWLTAALMIWLHAVLSMSFQLTGKVYTFQILILTYWIYEQQLAQTALRMHCF